MPGKRTPDSVEKAVYDMLMSQDFIDWFDGDFLAHLEGHDDAKSKEEMLEAIRGFLNL